MTGFAFDPFSEALRANPYPQYAELRRRAPVYRAESAASYVVSRYADVLFVIRHPELFSSSAMLALMMSGLGGKAAPGLGFGADAARLGALVTQLPVPASSRPGVPSPATT